MQEDKKKEVGAVYESIVENRLKGYQKETVKKVCKHFEDKNKCIIADEVGLGKTEIAKGVIASMVKNRWGNGKTDPLRVAYICPNQNIAEQNFRKLQLYSIATSVNLIVPEEIKKALKDNLEKAKNLLNEIKSGLKDAEDAEGKQKIWNNYEKLCEKLERDGLCSPGKNENSQSYFFKKIKSCKGCNFKIGNVFTRVWDWLIKIAEGRTIIDILEEENLRDVYLPESSESQISRSSEWARDRNNNSWGSIFIREWLFLSQLEVLSGDERTNWLTPIIEGYYKNIRVKIAIDKPTLYYKLNKFMARYLYSGESDKQYRLSTMHVRQAINEKFCKDALMQIDPLTPGTSFDKGNTYGTVSERATIGATYDVLVGNANNKAFRIDPKYKTESDSYASVYEDMCIDVQSLTDTETMKKMKQYLDNKNTSGVPKFDKLKEWLTEYNAKNFKYDLVIMDEFQNYEDLVKEHDYKNISSIVFNNKETKVLMLSATPFAINNYVNEIIDEDDINPKQEKLDQRGIIQSKEKVYDQFKRLIEFMVGSDKAECWLNRWEKAMNEIDRDSLEELLMDEAGIFRTERCTAANFAPVKREKKVLDSHDFSGVLAANFFAENISPKLTGVAKYVKTTPYALTFSKTYHLDIEKNDKGSTFGEKIRSGCYTYNNIGPKMLERVFIKKEILNPIGSCKTEMNVSNKKYNELEKWLFEKENICNMLWILPSTISTGKVEKNSVFYGMRGVSKSIIFSDYRMTPMALTYLLCHSVYRKQEGVPKEFANIQEEDLNTIFKDFIGGAFENKEKEEYKFSKLALEEYLKKLFRQPYAKAAVYANYKCKSPEEQEKLTGYSDYVRQYCQDGQLVEVIKEYISLLDAEYGNKKDKDNRIKKVISSVSKMLDASKPELILLDDQNKLQVEKMDTKNRFAAGLYAEKEGDINRRLKIIKAAFNSPFLPFVFSTTSIGTEGIDLHWYARNVIHWSIPARPVDYEQREGRVLRYKCHAFRLNEQLIEQSKKTSSPIGENGCIKDDWKQSGMFESQLNFFSDLEYDGEKGCYHINSITFCEKQSPEDFRYDEKMKIVDTYRCMIGRKADDIREDVLICLAPWVHRKNKIDK